MESLEPAKKLAWQQVIAILLTAGGFGLIAWSFVWTNVSARNTGWSQEQAREYQASAMKLHGLSHEFAHKMQQGEEDALQAELSEAQAEYNVLRSQLESAMGRPKRVALMLRLGGVLLIGVGGVSLYLRPPADHRPDF